MQCTRTSTREGRSNMDAAQITNGEKSPEADAKMEESPGKLRPGLFQSVN
jgi:hypothetical protein